MHPDAPDLWNRLAAAKEKGWTPARVNLLKKLWAEGLSCSQIAAELKHVTRNAVIGKVHRLGLSGRLAKASKAKPARPERTVSFRAKEVAAPPAEPFDATKRTRNACDVGGLTKTNCHWPVGDVGAKDFFFCGEPAQDGKSYCAGHYRKSVMKPRMGFTEQELARRRTMLMKGFSFGTTQLRLHGINGHAA